MHFTKHKHYNSTDLASTMQITREEAVL